MLLVSALGLAGCAKGKNCNFMAGLFDEPDCNALQLTNKVTYVGTNASCAGSPNSRRLVINCPPGSGSASQCTSIGNGTPAFSLVVSNNTSGNFTDADGTFYGNCQDLLTAYSAGSLENIAGIYVSDSTNSSTTVSCTDGGGCTLTSPTCYAGWDASSETPAGTASLPLGGNYLTCTYINSSGLAGNPPNIAVGAWASSIDAVTITGDLTFNAGWVDAY